MSPLRQVSMLLCVLTLISACAGKSHVQSEPPVFQHGFTNSAVPWTHSRFDNETGKFTFALFSDLTGGERDGVFEVAVEQLSLLRPEFIISVGDLIEGGSTDHGQLTREWNSFDERARRAEAPVFHVGGNHDLTNADMWGVWEERYGKRYYYFVYKDVLFLVLDTEDNPADFQHHIYEVRWTFLFMHKPAWERTDEENFSSIETALSDRPYTVFHGHVHSYLHQQRLGRDYIRLGTTGGAHAPDNPRAIDHVTLVTVSENGTDIANLRMSGIFDKTGEIPLNGNDLCLQGCAGK